MVTTVVPPGGRVLISGDSAITYTPGGTAPVPAGVTVEWDFDGDGNWDDPVEDITADVIALDTTTGRDWPSHITGRASPGQLRLTLNNTADAYSVFNSGSPLNTAPFALATGRMIRVRTTESAPTDPVLLTYDRFAGTGALAYTETGLPWVDHLPADHVAWVRDGDGNASNSTGPFALSTVDVGTSDYYLQIVVRRRDGFTNEASIIYRFDDEDNFGEIAYLDGFVGHYLYESAVYTLVDAAFLENRDWLTFGVHVSGSDVAVYFEGVEVFGGPGTAYTSTSTEVGIRSLWTSRRPLTISEFYAWDTLPTPSEGVIWTGFVSSVIPRINSRQEKTAEVTAEGRLMHLAQATVRGPVISPDLTASTPVPIPTGVGLGMVLSAAGCLHPPGGIDAGDVGLRTVALDQGNALALARRFEATELGFLHETPEGHIAFSSRSARAGSPVVAAFSDDPGTPLAFEALELRDWRRELINRVIAGVAADRPRLIRIVTRFGTSATNADANVKLPTTAQDGQPGDLIVVQVITSAGVTVGTPSTQSGQWVVPPGWTDLRGLQPDEPAKMRWMAKVLTQADVDWSDAGQTVLCHDDTSGAGGTWATHMYQIRDWVGSIAEGLYVGEPQGYGPPDSESLAATGENTPPALLLPWGLAPAMYIVTQGGWLSSGTTNIGATTQEGPGAYSYAGHFGAGSSGKQIGQRYAYRTGAETVEQSPPFDGTFTGFRFVETTAFAVRGAEGYEVTVDDLASQDRHQMIRVYDASDTLFADADDAEAFADAVLAQSSGDRPILRARFTATKAARYRAQAYRRRVGDRVAVSATGRSGFGFSGVFTIEAVHHELHSGSSSWSVTWELSPNGDV